MKVLIKPVFTRNIYYDKCPFGKELKEFPWEGQFNYLKENFTREMLAIIEEENGEEQIVGGFTLDYKEKDLPELIFFEVAEKRRGRGIGKKALLMLMDDLKKKGYKKLFVQTGRPIIYEKLGFKFEVVERRGLIIDLYDPFISYKTPSTPPLTLIYSDYFLWHDDANHPEVSGRISHTIRYLEKTGLIKNLGMEKPRYATEEELLKVHSKELIEVVKEASEKEEKIGPNNYTCKDTYDIARLCFGGCLLAGENIEKWKKVFVLSRPPGHHATRNKAMGFCFFNNIAGLAMYLFEKGMRPFIIDWDAHHGNGTQEILYEKPIYYLSIHQKYLFPNTGFPEERGEGEGKGYNLNILVPPLCEDNEYLECFKTVEREVKDYSPDIILVSAGQDGHKRDLLTGMMLSTQCYYEIAKRVGELAERYCKGKIILVLEGGYNLDVLGELNGNIIKGITGFE